MTLGFKIAREKVPRLYDFSFKQGSPPTLVLMLNKDFVEANKDLVIRESFIEGIRKQHNLGEFHPLRDDYFGFDNVIKKGKQIGDYIEFVIEIPAVVSLGDKPCPHCDGTGRQRCFCNGIEDLLEGECRSCGGTGYSPNVKCS